MEKLLSVSLESSSWTYQVTSVSTAAAVASCMTCLAECVETSVQESIMASLPVMDVQASSNAPSDEEENMAARVGRVSSVSLTRHIVTSAEDADSGDVFRWE